MIVMENEKKLEMDDALSMLKGFERAIEKITRNCTDRAFGISVNITCLQGLKNLIRNYEKKHPEIKVI